MVEKKELTPGTVVKLDGCNGTWTVIGWREKAGWMPLKVQPENLEEDAIWCDFEAVTEVIVR